MHLVINIMFSEHLTSLVKWFVFERPAAKQVCAQLDYVEHAGAAIGKIVCQTFYKNCSMFSAFKHKRKLS